MQEKEGEQWRDILHRLLDNTLFLAKQTLAFRGYRGDETSLNRGNFLETVYLVSKYDSVLKEHLMKLEKRPGKLSVSYLSPKIQNEFISVLANHVKQKQSLQNITELCLTALKA